MAHKLVGEAQEPNGCHMMSVDCSLKTCTEYGVRRIALALDLNLSSQGSQGSFNTFIYLHTEYLMRYVSKGLNSSWGARIAEPRPEVFFFFSDLSSTFCLCETYCSKTFQPRINTLNLSNYITFTVYEKHMQSMNLVLLCRNALRATCDSSEDCEVRYNHSDACPHTATVINPQRETSRQPHDALSIMAFVPVR